MVIAAWKNQARCQSRVENKTGDNPPLVQVFIIDSIGRHHRASAPWTNDHKERLAETPGAKAGQQG